ncbi:MAG: DUF370 domain-containing protein [Ruminococcaceae bacterium]|nr:DUF370 domain-containing protein [Oscillospiraceae bacterium]
MYLHIGGETTVSVKNIIAIMDMETSTTAKSTREFLKVVEEEGFVMNVSDDLPKSYVICEENGRSRVYISPISSATLLKRADLKSLNNLGGANNE